MGQLAPFPTSKGVWGIAVSSLSGVRSKAPAAQRFACSLRSPGSLFCYTIKGKQLHKSFNLAAGGLRQPPWRARITWARGGVNSCSTGDSTLPQLTPWHTCPSVQWTASIKLSPTLKCSDAVFTFTHLVVLAVSLPLFQSFLSRIAGCV